MSFAKTLVAAVTLLLATHAQALYTNYLDTTVATLTGVSNYLATLPTPTPAQKKQLTTVKRALKDLSKPSTSVAGDYALFLNAAIHLGPIALQEPFGSLGSNVFAAFQAEVGVEIYSTSIRLSSLNDFVRTKRPASNQLAQAVAKFSSIGTTVLDPQLGLLVAGQAFKNLTAAQRLVALGEAHLGLVPPSLVGFTLTHHERGQTGTEQFDDVNNATEHDNDGTRSVTYTFTRTGLDTATLILSHAEGGGTSTTTVKMRFTSETGGTFTFQHTGSDGGSQSGPGTFTLASTI